MKRGTELATNRGSIVASAVKLSETVAAVERQTPVVTLYQPRNL